jgi:hypothetical protein
MIGSWTFVDMWIQSFHHSVIRSFNYSIIGLISCSLS